MGAMRTDRIPYLAIAGIAAIAAVAFFAGTLVSSLTRNADDAPAIAGHLWPNPPTIEEFSLTSQHNQPFTKNQLLGRWSFIFFGFTHCPDVCPTSMQSLKEVRNLLANDETFSTQGQIVFVSVDPERDTPEILRQYLGYFHDDFIGITGSDDALKKLTRSVGILYAKIPDGEHYTMDHSAAILLVDPLGQVLGLFSMPHVASEIAASFKAISHFHAN